MAGKSRPKKPQDNQESDSSQKGLNDQVKIALIGTIGTIVVAIVTYLMAPAILAQFNQQTPTEVPQASCSYPSGYNDNQAITSLIKSEAQAVLTEDMDLIKAIFAEDAIIVDVAANGGTPQKWNNPINRYQPLFEDYDFFAAQNTNIQATGPINNDTVEYISGSHGKFTVKGIPGEYKNPDDASRWTIKKIGGCWKITRFEFNIH